MIFAALLVAAAVPPALAQGVGQGLPGAARGGEATAMATRAAAPVSLVGRHVCSAHGLYREGARWCGVVRDEIEGEILVQMADLRLNNPLGLGFAADECTGGQFLGWFDLGNRRWVPTRCVM